MKDVDVVFLTIGTSWVYKLNGHVVNNCHKRPQSLFEKGLPITGFVKQPTNDDIQIGDVLLFESMSGNLDHVAVYIGDNMILNHNIKKLSCREPFDLVYQQALRGVYRYEA